MSGHIFLISVFVLAACSAEPSYRYEGAQSKELPQLEENFKPSGGYIRTPNSAAAIAEIVGKEFYGEDVIENQKPLLVKKYGDVWLVTGTFRGGKNIKGGNFEIRISSDSGKILGMIHGE